MNPQDEQLVLDVAKAVDSELLDLIPPQHVQHLVRAAVRGDDPRAAIVTTAAGGRQLELVPLLKDLAVVAAAITACLALIREVLKAVPKRDLPTRDSIIYRISDEEIRNDPRLDRIVKEILDRCR